jgi:hypothetical protein
VVRSSVGNSGGKYIVNKAKNPEQQPIAGKHHHISLIFRGCQ